MLVDPALEVLIRVCPEELGYRVSFFVNDYGEVESSLLFFLRRFGFEVSDVRLADGPNVLECAHQEGLLDLLVEVNHVDGPVGWGRGRDHTFGIGGGLVLLVVVKDLLLTRDRNFEDGVLRH